MAWYDENQSNQNPQEPNGSTPAEPQNKAVGDTAVNKTDGNPADSTQGTNAWVNPSVTQQQPNTYTVPSTYSKPQTYYTPSSPYQNPYSWQQPSAPSPSPVPDPKPPKKKKGVVGLIIGISVASVAVMAALAILLSSVFDNFHLPTDDGNGDEGSSLTDTKPGEARPGPTLEIASSDETAEMLSIKSAIQMNLNSTVSIVVYSKQSNSYYPGFGGSSGSELVEAGGSTGIVMSKDGYIITNCHCVINEQTGEAYDRIDVHMYDKTVYEDAEVIGVDEDTDLAVIKVKATNLSPATFGDSSKLELGDTVIALGNAGGLGWTPTRGIISGSARDVYDDTGYSIKCLQTDAAINPGNSGGPLINIYGQVVGINSAKIVATGYESLGFSIPINEAKTIIDSLIKYGYVTGRVSLGITGNTVKLLNYPGFQIASISDESGLKNTEAQPGDIITHVDGVRIEDHAQLRSQLTKHEVGDTVKLTLVRLSTRGVQTFEVKCKLVANKK